MNSLNNDPNPSLNQNKFKSFDIPNQFYQYYRIPNNASISQDFAQLHNTYGPNQLLATQFSFQYSDNQGLGDGINANNHPNIWNTGPINAAQSRSNQPQNIDPNTAHFFSIPSHGPPQATDQNLFYQYGYGAANNMYWTHPSMVEYKSPNQNYSLTSADKSQSWSETVFNSQYPTLSNSMNYKTTISPIEQANQILSINNIQANHQKHLIQNGYQISNGLELATRVAHDNTHMMNVERTVVEKSDNFINQEKKFPIASSSYNVYSQMDSLQSQLANDCSIHKDNSNFEPNQGSIINNNQRNYSPTSISKHCTMDKGENSDFWNQDISRTSNSVNVKSYAKVAKLTSRNSNSNQSTIPHYNNNNNNVTAANSRSNYKSSINGFSAGYSRPGTSSNNSNWFNNSPSANENGWNTTKSKWSQESNNSRNNMNNSAADPNIKSSWANKVALNNDENIKSVEYIIKEIQGQINPKRLDMNFEKTRYFVIKSYSEDDVHRSIKYKIWCSTKEGNKRLNEAFQNAQKVGGHVLLFFSVNGSGHFCGIAEMTSCVDESAVTKVWCQDKWKGRFSVKWIYVKDVPNTQLRHICTKVNPLKSGIDSSIFEIKPITNLRDATELKSERTPGSSYKDDPGYQALKIIMDCKSSMSIFDDFMHYEKRELKMES